MDSKTVTMSMTKANKILTRIRERPEKNRKSRYSSYMPDGKFSIEIDLLSYNAESIKERLKEMQDKFDESLMKSCLVEKWRNRLFELNVRYGIHAVMAEIDLLKEEKSSLTNILNEHQSKYFTTFEIAEKSMNAVMTSDKKYEFKWNVSPFDITKIKNRIAAINKKVGKLEEKRDDLNIQNSFTLELTPTEYALTDME